MIRKTHLAAFALGLAILAQDAAASLIIQGDFVVPFAGAPIASLDGSFTAVFDDSFLTGVGVEQFDDLAILTALTLVPNPLNLTMFTTANTGLQLRFTDGVLTGLVIGGLPDVSFLGDGPDDFLVRYTNGTANVAGINYDGMLFTALAARGEYRVRVPSPGTLPLLLSGLVLLFVRKAKYESAPA